MSSFALPQHHVPRPRLAGALARAPIGLIEAGGGYGKSVLVGELRRELGIASADAVLERDTDEAEQLVGALRRGFRRAGLSDLAAALTGAHPADVAAAFELESDPVLLVVEEAQHASGAAAELLAGLARALPEENRLLIVGRRLDPRLTALRDSVGATFLDSEALAFDDAELRQLLVDALRDDAGSDRVAELRRVAFGWPAASALAAAALARNRRAASPGHEASSLGELLDNLLAGLGEGERARLARLAHLPQLSEPVAAAVAGPGAIELVAEAGLPLRSGRPGWVELADPVREELSAREPLPAEQARAAASAYAAAGELATGLALLAQGGDGEGAAGLLAGRRWQELQALDLAELRAIVSTLSDEALAAHPYALVQVARIAEQEVDLELRAELLTRARELVGDDDPALREIEAELAANEAIVNPGDEVERRAQAVVDEAAGTESAARIRALTALARVEAWRGDPASVLSAERRLAETAALCRLAGEVEWEARALTALGYRVAFARGDLDQAVTQMNAALALLPESGSERAAAATFVAEALAYVGRFDEAEAAIGEAATIARRLGDHRLQGYAAWTGTTLASLQGDAAATVQRIRTAELHPGDWYEHPTGIEFLADATLALARTGDSERAGEYAERARERAEAAGYPEIGWIATGAVAARWGDPEEAERDLTAFAGSPQQAPRDAWRTLLLRAMAASRGDGRAGELAAEAFEAAAELGRPDLPTLHEPDLAATLVPLAVEAGSRAARAAGEREGTVRITVLGGFAMSASGRPLEPPAGRPSTLVKVLALAGGPVAAGEAIELLWPGVDEATGRQRLRNLLNRLRTACPGVADREGETLVLGGAEVDADGFERDAAAALSAPAEQRPGLARTALARYKGELLPGDRYEAWAAAPRERLRRRYLELLDLLADDAVDRGDVDEAIRRLDQAQAAEPLDEERYLRAAELLLFQGRRGSAQSLVERAAEVRNQLGLGPSDRLERLRSATGAE